MRKIVSLCVCMILIFTSVMPAFSSDIENEAMKKVLLDIKERIGSTDEYDEFYSNISENGDYDIYNFSWSCDDKNLNITANSDGIITSYGLYEYNNADAKKQKPSINKIRSEEVIVKAEALVRSLNPAIADNIRIIPNVSLESLMNTDFTFDVQRTQCGIDVVGDSGYVTVDSNAEKIKSFRIKYTPGLEFENTGDVIDAESAKVAFKKNLGLKLQYVCESQKGVLEYVPNEYDSYVSAINGNKVTPISPEYHFLKNESAMDTTISGVSGGGYAKPQLSEAELENAALLEMMISKEEGETLLRNNDILSITDSMELMYFNTSYYDDEETYYYTYNFENDSETASATINAKTGEIQSYSFYNGKYDEVTEDKTTLVKSLVEKLAPGYYKSDDSLGYRFDLAHKGNYTFARYVNGIECVSNSIVLSLNSEDDISRYYINHDKVEFESPDGIISESEACDRLFELCGYKMYYYPSCSKEGMHTADKAILIYDFESGYLTLDAKTGELKNYSDDESAIGNYTDIDGHYAENVIRTLADFGIGFTEDEFRPDDLITQKDYVVLITSALIGNEGIVLYEKSSSYSHYYYRAETESIIVTEDEKAPHANVSREQAAVYMIRALGLDEVASLDGIYVSEFSDVTNHIGHISILNAMGVVNGYGGIFNPDKMLTRADAMIMLYNYLSR